MCFNVYARVFANGSDRAVSDLAERSFQLGGRGGRSGSDRCHSLQLIHYRMINEERGRVGDRGGRVGGRREGRILVV